MEGEVISVRRAGLGVCGPDAVEEYCVWKLQHEQIPDSHRERSQVSMDVGDAEAVEIVVWVCVLRFPGRGLVLCELAMIHECRFGAQAAVTLTGIRRKAEVTCGWKCKL